MKKPTLYIVGDSTVSSFDDKYYLPRCGYGTQIANYLNGIAVKNLALGGRSSKSFAAEENYKLLLSSIGSGDYLSIGFGHNDEKAEPERYTNPMGGLNDEGSFAHSLYENYIVPARERGAIPILCTPIVRLSEEDDYSGACGHITSTVGTYAGGDYPAAIRKLAEQTGVTMLDLTALSMARYKASGHEKASRFHAWACTVKGVPAGLDGTHLNRYGAMYAAYDWATALSKTDCPLKNYLVNLAPPAESEYKGAVNENFRELVYSPFGGEAAKELHFSLPSPWYGTVTGDFGGEHFNEFIVEGDGQNFTVGNFGVVPRGKISNATDGFACAFLQLPSSLNFTITAEAEVSAVGGGANGQSAFGIMLRDDIYADQYVASLNSNYVAAGISGDCALFCREGGTLKKMPNPAGIVAGEKFTLALTRINQQIRASVNGFSQSWFDFDLTPVDGKFDYLCLFAARSITVKFTAVRFTPNGTSSRA